MQRYLKLAKILAALLSAKAVIFLILTAFGLTAIPPQLAVGFTITWFLIAGLFFIQARRVEQRLSGSVESDRSRSYSNTSAQVKE